MAFLNPEDWDAYKSVINEYHEDAFQQTITWNTMATSVDPHGEDMNEREIDIELKGLIGYNYFRSWPVNKVSEAGETDKQSMIMYFNLAYLTGLGHINAEGQFQFNPGRDYFTVQGVRYKPAGDSLTAQAHDNPLLVFIIVKREELPTSQQRFP